MPILLTRYVVAIAAVALMAACAVPTPSPTATPVPTATPTVAASPPENPSLALLPRGVVTLGAVAFNVWIAETQPTRVQGLSDQPSMPRDWGMWFDRELTGAASFWMKNMHFPLDMLWLDESFRVVHVTHNAEVPETGTPDAELPRYRPPVPVRYVLEVNAGLVRELGLQEGVVVEVVRLTDAGGG